MIAMKEGQKSVERQHVHFLVKHEDTLESQMMRQIQNISYSWHSNINIILFVVQIFLIYKAYTKKGTGQYYPRAIKMKSKGKGKTKRMFICNICTAINEVRGLRLEGIL